MGARAFIPVALAGAVLFSLAPSTPAAAATITTEGQQIIQIAEVAARRSVALRRDRAVRLRLLRVGRLLVPARRRGRRIKAGSLRSARSLYLYFRSRGKTSRTNPKVGDLVMWGYGSHVGIYIGDGKAISTLRNGVRIHGVFAVTARFTTYLHTGMSTRPVS